MHNKVECGLVFGLVLMLLSVACRIVGAVRFKDPGKHVGFMVFHFLRTRFSHDGGYTCYPSV